MKRKAVFFSVLSILLIILFVFGFGSSVLAQTALDDVAKSVVQIAWKFPDREPFRDLFRDPFTGEVNLYVVMGSGFMVGTEADQEYRYCITNWHVVDATWGQDLPREFRFNANEIEVYILRAMDDFVPVRIYSDLRTSDIAVLEIDPSHRLFGYVPLEFAHSGMVNRGEDVWAIGFPATAATLADMTAAYYTDATVTKGIISRVTTVSGVPVYQMDTYISGGNSGGPLVNKDGQIIGINTFGLLVDRGGFILPEQMNYAVQIDVLTDHLRSRGIPFLEAGSVPPAPEPTPTPEPTPEPIPVPEPVEVEDDSNQTLLYVGLGVAAVLLIVVAVILTRGKKSVPVASMPPAPPAPPTQHVSAPVTQAGLAAPAPPVTRAAPIGPKTGVKGISGQFAGQTVDFVGGQLVIGRDPRLAQLVYPQSNDNISRKHLTIRFDEKTQKFILEDSSSNGTFLSSNEKLESGKPYYLNPGDRFYVADPKEVFELTKG